MPNGFAAVGVLGVPWIFLGLYAFAVVLVYVAVQSRQAEQATVVAAQDESSTPASAKPSRVGRRILLVAVLLAGLGFMIVRDWDPLWAGAVMAPGPLVAEIRADGTWRSDSIENASSYSSSVDDCTFECPGPHWIYRLAPGATFAFIVSIWNHSSIPITIVGRPMPPNAPVSSGLALLQNPTVVSADPSNLTAFQPLTIEAGATASLVWIDTASSCANPTATVKALEPGAGWARGLPFVYEILGWRREGVIWPHFSFSVAGCDADPVLAN